MELARRHSAEKVGAGQERREVRPPSNAVTGTLSGGAGFVAGRAAGGHSAAPWRLQNHSSPPPLLLPPSPLTLVLLLLSHLTCLDLPAPVSTSTRSKGHMQTRSLIAYCLFLLFDKVESLFGKEKEHHVGPAWQVHLNTPR